MRLPANPESKRGVVLGEGKPENQNHAIIFCHNEALQSIDMNQVCKPCRTNCLQANHLLYSLGILQMVSSRHNTAPMRAVLKSARI